MIEEPKPDLVVGVDLGQTCTGVAYSFLAHGQDNVRWIQKWPGRSQAAENKVPTTLVYPHGSDQPSSWGFKTETTAEQSTEHGVTREWFKTLLDHEGLRRYNSRTQSDKTGDDDVRHWFRDYLTALYNHIERSLKAELPNFNWSAAKVEFLFSVPTTWKPDVVAEFETIVRQAGFTGPASSSHTVTVGLTEPEAAAVWTSTAAAGMFKENDILVVCDAGGGTTDLSAMRVTDTAVGALSLKVLRQIDVVAGETIGSAAIDFAFEELVRARLQEADNLVKLPRRLDSDDAAWHMMKCKEYQNVKCDHGAADESPIFSVPVPHLDYEYSNPGARIEHQEMYFDKGDLRSLFDDQIEKLFKLIDRQLSSLQNIFPNQPVNHLVLSGGLGQSPYVQRRLKERYGAGAYFYQNAENTKVQVAPDPQLAVCKGLVADRLRKLRAGHSVLGWRCCRASYGLICKELYDKKNSKHVGRKTEKDLRDGKQYIPNSIDWFVVKGSPVSIDKPIVHPFRRKIGPGDPKRVFPTKIVVSYSEKDMLPSQLEPGVDILCQVDSDLSGADEKRFKEKNKKFWQTRESYFEVAYQVKVVIGPADLRFELWFNGEKMSKDNSIKVEWAPSTAPSTANLQPARTPLIEDAPVPVGNRSRLGLDRLLIRTPPDTP